MHNKKGFTMALNVVIALLVLLLVAFIVIMVVNGKIFGGLTSFRNKGDQQECLANRGIYCQNNILGCWNSSEQIIMKGSSKLHCNKVLGRDLNSSLFSCQYNVWVPKEAYPIVVDPAKTYDNIGTGTDKVKLQKKICLDFQFFWNKTKKYCQKSKSDITKIDFSFLNDLMCGSQD